MCAMMRSSICEVVGRHDHVAGRRDEGPADPRPCGVRTGMFCRFGSLLDRRPVMAVACPGVGAPARCGFTIFGSLSGVSAFELRQRTVFEDQFRQRIVIGEPVSTSSSVEG